LFLQWVVREPPHGEHREVPGAQGAKHEPGAIDDRSLGTHDALDVRWSGGLRTGGERRGHTMGRPTALLRPAPEGQQQRAVGCPLDRLLRHGRWGWYEERGRSFEPRR